MEALCISDYQDIYRVKDGVLLVINKFKYVTDDNGIRNYIGYPMSHRRYTKGCQSSLCVMKDDYSDNRGNTYKSGQVIYNGYPIELVDREEWNFQIKTTGDCLSGTFEEITFILKNILKKVCETNERIIHSD